MDLDDIDVGNVSELRPLCAFQTAEGGSFHTNPIVYRGVMCLTTRAETIDLDAGSCRVRWRVDHVPGGQANRGVALNATTGRVMWERRKRIGIPVLLQ